MDRAGALVDIGEEIGTPSRPPSSLIRSTMISAASRASTPKPGRPVRRWQCRCSGCPVCLVRWQSQAAGLARRHQARLMFPPNPCFLPRLLRTGLLELSLSPSNLHNSLNRAPDGTRPLDAPAHPTQRMAIRIDDHLHGAAQAAWPSTKRNSHASSATSSRVSMFSSM